TYSPAMGMYLSSLKNRKGDAEAGRYPDENFAREIMQLFSIGLWELNADGSRRLDGNGHHIPTYDNSDITEMAKVFTGFSYGKNGTNNDVLTFHSTGINGNAFLHPMKVYDEEHEPGPKYLLSGVALNDVDNGGEALNGEQEVQATLDMLSDHANTAPFIAKLLIQRLTSSNPGADYLRRVVDSWRIEGAPERRLGRVIEAILLDPDVRNGNSSNQGKVREPVIRLTHLIRALEFGNEGDRYYFNANALDADLGQHPMLSPTVFNFYLPSYSPQGELADQDLVSPELEITSVVQMIGSDNLYQTFIDSGYNIVPPNYSTLLALEGSTSDLLDYLELLFSSRPLSEETRATMTTAIDSQATPLLRVKTAAHLIITCPEVTVLK
ncbi:DUF1800 domain-containing protein, partial [Akkermansiaceae bacterium]|nr:DUF1800 domain-containing protein [Akkermansiaceae bacterium]